MKTKLFTILAVVMFLGVCTAKADLVFDSGYNTYDDSYGYNFEVWVINDAHLDVLGGAMWKLELMNYATANVYGGDIDLLALNHNTVVNIYSSDIDFLAIQDFSVIDIYGGTLDYFAAAESSLAYLYAYDVTYHPTDGLKDDGWIEGIYISNDTPFSFSFYNDVSYSHINIVPEPSTLLLFGLGFVALRRKNNYILSVSRKATTAPVPLVFDQTCVAPTISTPYGISCEDWLWTPAWEKPMELMMMGDGLGGGMGQGVFLTGFSEKFSTEYTAEVYQPEPVEEEQPEPITQQEIEDTLKWLDEVWLYPEVREAISEDDWLESVEKVKS